MTSLLLVRHAQSTWNASGRWQGQADPPLSEHGESQARAAAARLGTFDAIVASPLERAHRTAELIAEELGVGPVLIEADLVERDTGPWSGLTSAEIEVTWPGALAERRFPPGFEPDGALEARARRALKAVCDVHAPYPDAEVLVVTHGGLLLTLERSCGDEQGRYPNLSGRWARYTEGRLTLGERVALVEPTGGTWRPAAGSAPRPR